MEVSIFRAIKYSLNENGKIDISIYNQISNIDLVNHIDRVGQLFYSK